MNLSALRTVLCAEHHHEPQLVRRIEVAIGELSSGLGALAAMGHPMHLEEGHRPIELGWPRLLFHISAAPNGRLVHGEAEARELGAGWYLSSAEAQHADGMDTQFAGRGGVARKNVLMIVKDYLEFKPPSGPTPAERIAEWKLSRISKLMEGMEDAGD